MRGKDVPALVRLVERQHVRDLVVLLCVGDVVGPARGAPVLVGVQQGHVFEAVDRGTVDDGLPVVHPGDLVVALEQLCVLRARNAVVLLREGNTTLASRGSLGRGGISEGAEGSKAHKESGFDGHDCFGFCKECFVL
jgi:hypothetical protein